MDRHVLLMTGADEDKDAVLREGFWYHSVEDDTGEQYVVFQVGAVQAFSDSDPKLSLSGTIAGVEGEYPGTTRMQALADYYNFDLDAATDVLNEYADLPDLDETIRSAVLIYLKRDGGHLASVEIIDERAFPFEPGSETHEEMIERIRDLRF